MWEGEVLKALTETADTTCALSGSISGAGKAIEIRLRMCGPPLYTSGGGKFFPF